MQSIIWILLAYRARIVVTLEAPEQFCADDGPVSKESNRKFNLKDVLGLWATDVGWSRELRGGTSRYGTPQTSE